MSPCFSLGDPELELNDRLIDLVAEDNAIEDTIYHITRALDSERIDLDRFLKVSSLPVYWDVRADASVDTVFGKGTIPQTSIDRAYLTRNGANVVRASMLGCNSLDRLYSPRRCILTSHG